MSEMYSSKTAMEAGIDSVKTNAHIAGLVDQTSRRSSNLEDSAPCQRQTGARRVQPCAAIAMAVVHVLRTIPRNTTYWIV